MRHQRHKHTLGVSASHRKSMLANMVCSLVKHNRIKTTVTRAKEASKLADKMITLAKRKDLHATRQIVSTIRCKTTAKKLVDEFGPLFSKRSGGYTRVVKLGNRPGDNASLAILEFTEFPEIKETKKKAVKKEKVPETKSDDAVSEKRSDKSSFFTGLRRFIKK